MHYLCVQVILECCIVLYKLDMYPFQLSLVDYLLLLQMVQVFTLVLHSKRTLSTIVTMGIIFLVLLLSVARRMGGEWEVGIGTYMYS